MLPVPHPAQIAQLDQATVRQQNITSLELMETAATACAAAMREQLDNTPDQRPTAVTLLCGRGNNGGDGYVIARLLHKQGHVVRVLDFALGQASADNRANRERAERLAVAITTVGEHDPLPAISAGDLLIDAIFGTGLSRPVGGGWATLFAAINKLPNERWAVDVPSGLFAGEPTDDPALRAARTFSLGYPKPAEFLPEAADHYGLIHRVTFPLAGAEHLDEPPFAHVYTTTDARDDLRPRGRFDHKGTFGHALLVAGAKGTMGAAVLSARAVLRAGAGLLTCHVPARGYQIMQISVPEAMCLTDEEDDYVTEIGALDRYRAIGVGPGLGQADDTAEALRDLLYRAEFPLVLDADALNILARHRDWWQHVPAGSILTPHPKEFDRLFGAHDTTLARWATQREQAAANDWVVVLKGGHTTVATPDGRLTVNTTGNPGMGTAGAGDVLTGVLTGLLAQGYAPETAARLGVHLHGLAGDNAGSERSIIASDLVENLAMAYFDCT